MRKKAAKTIICIFLLFSMMSGCQSSAEKPLPEQNADQNIKMTASERRVLASKLSQIANNVEGVQKTSVVVSNSEMADKESGSNINDNEMSTVENGLIIMVGITFNQDVNKKADNVMQTVKNKIKASDKRIKEVLITTDPNLIKRIDDLAAGIIEGKPIQRFEKDINDLNNKLKKQ